jgi:SAM-dependent methyltransferase
MSEQHNLEAGIAQASNYWNTRASHSSTNCERVESSQRAQKMRYEAFALYHDLTNCSLLDVGCGTGDLWEHVKQRTPGCEYVGFDLSTEMIAHCRKRFPDVRFESGNILEWNPGRLFDYTVSFGIHNIKVDGGRAILEQVTRRQFELCRVASHISILTDRYDGFAPHIQSWRAEEILNLALTITPYVVLRHDYLPNDFSITLYREPLIDTHPDLILD